MTQSKLNSKPAMLGLALTLSSILISSPAPGGANDADQAGDYAPHPQGSASTPLAWRWSNAFGPNLGCDGRVEAIRALSDGRLILGGEFSVCDEVAAANVVIFDPDDATFSPIIRNGINGVSGRVWSMVRAGSDIYVAGQFTFAGDLQVNNITRFDGTDWHALTVGVSSGLPGNEVRTLLFDEGMLYAGGRFLSGGGTPLSRIGRWDGSSWNDMDGGVDGTGLVSVDHLIADPSQPSTIYATGIFVDASATQVNNIARWDGTQWHELADSSGVIGLELAGTALEIAGGDVIVASAFDNGAGALLSGVRRFNGTDWLPVGSNPPNGDVNDLTFHGGELIAGGQFVNAGGQSARGLARFDGSVWQPLLDLQPGVDDRVDALLAVGSNLIVGGRFSNAGGRPASTIARWDGTRFFSLGNVEGAGVQEEIRAMVRYQDELVISGSFLSAGGNQVQRIARWNEQDWQPIGAGFSSTPLALLVQGDDLYAGGAFTLTGFTSLARVAHWDGSHWNPLGDGLNSTVEALAWRNGELYAGGFFTASGSTTVNRVARFDGVDWKGLGDGVNGQVTALVSYQNELIVAGNFDSAGGQIVDGLAAWDGTDWRAFADDVAGNIETLIVHQNDLYAGGKFGAIDGQTIDNVARYDGSNWFAVGASPPGGEVRALLASGNWLFAGGEFAQQDSETSANLAVFDGQEWQIAGDGIGHGGRWKINALETDGQPVDPGLPPPVFIGGLFGQAGPHASANVNRITALSAGLFKDRFEQINENQ